MIKVFDNLYVGNQKDFELHIRFKDQGEWNIVQACKEPYHRKALGYTGRSAPKWHSEYLVAKRENRLILNLIDADTPKYISKEIIDEALEFIEESLNKGQKVLLHCNQGRSRSSGIAILYLAQKGVIRSDSFLQARNAFKEIYPPCSLAGGMREFLKQHWNEYMTQKSNE